MNTVLKYTPTISATALTDIPALGSAQIWHLSFQTSICCAYCVTPA